MIDLQNMYKSKFVQMYKSTYYKDEFQRYDHILMQDENFKIFIHILQNEKAVCQLCEDNHQSISSHRLTDLDLESMKPNTYSSEISRRARTSKTFLLKVHLKNIG